MNRQELEKNINLICIELLELKGFIDSITILERLNIITKKQIEDWRFGKVPYLEKICDANLNRLSFINKTIKTFAKNKNLKQSHTIYHQYGEHKNTKLVFSKTKEESIENGYATHFLDIEKINSLKIKKENKIDSKPASL